MKKEHYDLPFKEFDKPLKEILMSDYLEPVSKWLIGERENSLLAMEAKSVWETGLSVLFLAEMDNLTNDESISIKSKVVSISNWLLERKTSDRIIYSQNEINIYYWDKVTWDTSVVIRSLLIMIHKYPNEFNESKKEEILEIVTKSSKWLYYMFLNWDREVKYPFGPADLGQILTTILLLQEKFPEIYIEVCKQFDFEDITNIASNIVKKLLSIKTEFTKEEHQIEIPLDNNKQEIVTFWWDDYFSTAEVVESLALFYVYCVNSEKKRYKSKSVGHKNIKKLVREALIKTCLYFEKEQVDGMWGNHIDTIKVLYAYVRVRDLVLKNVENDDPIITPEIHTTFKALRWMCDEKQIFKDKSTVDNSPKSFMHTMYLTVFYSHTLLEVHNRWDPVNSTVGKLYDDVVWSSPTRTTPERAKRLALEMEYINLIEKNELNERYLIAAKRITQLTLFFTFSFFIIFFGVGKYSKIVQSSFKINFQQQGSSIDLIAIFIALIVIGTSVVFGVKKLFNK